ncbi:MAG: gliding motility-associated C-terminal domain-containing protein [Saprospiraceae bacterium]|nr:gliding motility-associated C-terminal domain-containing protein [Saprospiraceae bacterium]
MITYIIKKNIKGLMLLFLTLVAVFPGSIQATHIVGGDMTYRHLGNNNFEITLTLRRDCQLGQIGYDDPASIGIFAASSNTLLREVRIPFMASDTVGNTIVSACGFIGSEVCVQRTTYRDTVELPFLAGGYIVSYQRCCRNGSLNNIIIPLETGTTEWIEITEKVLLEGNNSPAFTRWPDIYICANQPLNFDHSAFDADGDSLVYKLCTPFEGATIQFPRPQPPAVPPYNSVLWQSPYGLNDMLGGTPLSIDPNTGVITANPNLVGQFLVGVCVEEYRNGVLLSTVRRDFQYNVRVCSTPVSTDFEVAVNKCDSLSFVFTNKSVDAETFEWNFNYPSTDPKFISTSRDAVFTYDTPGVYNIRLKGSSSNGACDSIVYKQVVASTGSDVPDLNIVSDNITLCAGETVALLNNPNAGNTYSWSPQQGLDLTDPANPKFSGVESGVYSVTVTNPNNCTNSGIITITVNPATSPLIISGNRNICDNNVELTVSGAAGIFQWSADREYNVIISTSPSLITEQTEIQKTYYVKSQGAICGNLTDSVTVLRQPVMVTYQNTASICRGGENTITIVNANPEHNLMYSWNDPHIVSSNNNVITITTLVGDVNSFIVKGIAINQFGCSEEISINVNIIENESVSFDAQLKSCDDYTMCFTISGSFDGNVVWNFGSGLSVDSSNDKNPCFKYKNPGTYTVTLTSLSTGCPFSTLTKVITVPPLGDKTVSVSSILNDCNTNKVCFAITGNYLGNLIWNFGDPASASNTSSSASPCHNFSGPGTYTVTLTNDNPLCPFEKVIKTVVIDPEFVINPIADEVICEGETIKLNATSNDPAATYKWYNSAGTQIGQGSMLTINPMEDITVKVKAVNSKGCTDSTTVTVRIFKFNYTVSLPTVICPNEEFQVKLNISSPENYTYVWSPAECVVMGAGTNQPILLAVPGKNISVIITNKETGCNETKNIVPDIKAPLVYNFSGELCNNQPSTLQINVTNPNDYTYEWSPTSVIISGAQTPNPVVKVEPGQIMKVIVTNKITGCTNELTYSPVVLPLVNVSFTETNVEINQGKDTDLTIKNPVTGSVYVWSTGESGTSIKVDPIETTTYTVTVTDKNGCTGTGKITVTVRVVGCTDREEYLPNAFTPNGDNSNDVLMIKSNVITEMTLVIYNRWGQEMFSTNDINEGWDGTYQGKLMSPDAYAYYLRATCINGDKFIKKGNVSLLK